MTSKDELQTWLDYHEMAGYEYQQLATPGEVWIYHCGYGMESNTKGLIKTPLRIYISISSPPVHMLRRK